MSLVACALSLAVVAVVCLEREMQADSYSFNPREQPSAVYGMRVVVPQSSQDAFFAAVKSFAGANGFQEKVRSIKAGSNLTYIDLWRLDIAIGGGNLFEAPEFELAFYIDPTKGGSLQAATKLADDLTRLVSELPGVSVAQTK